MCSSDLSLEQDSDIVLFLYREDYYDKTKMNVPTELGIAKHRMGRTGYVNLVFSESSERYFDYSRETNPPYQEA